MPSEDTICRYYEIVGNHRLVAEKFRLPIHYVMRVLGLMSQELFDIVNGGR